MKKFIALALAAAMATSLVACGGSSAPAASSAAPAESAPAAEAAGEYDALEPVELILADSAATGAALPVFNELLAEKVSAITGGQLTLDVHSNSELGGDADLLRQTQSGDIDMVGSQIAPVVSFVPELAVFDLPMVFATADGDKIDAVLNGDSAFNAAVSEAYEKAGLHLLGFLQNATFRLTTSNTDLQTLADFKGLQIRTMENSNHMAFWTAIGAQPTPLAWPEVYISLQNGTIDAEENAADTVAGANFQEVQKYLACTNHILYCNQIAINADTWANLDPAYQAALEQAMQEALDEMRPQLGGIDADNKAKLAEGGMTIIEYEPSFFEEVLALEGVQKLYSDIDAATNGLAATLQADLAA